MPKGTIARSRRRIPTMEVSISDFCVSMSSFLSHLQSASDALSESLRRRPIPLDSAAATFIGRLGQRVAAAGEDLELLEDMAMGTVSVAELLGHCTEVYQRNQAYIDLLHDRLTVLGYVHDVDSGSRESDDLDADKELLSPWNGLEKPILGCESSFRTACVIKSLDDGSPRLNNSDTLQNMGLSDAGLAILTFEAEDTESPRHQEELVSTNSGEMHENKTHDQSTDGFYAKGMVQCDVILEASKASIEISREDYDKLPAYVKSLTSWEDLQEAVSIMNSGLSKEDVSKERGLFSQEDLDALGLGRKGKSYVLALIRMNRLAVETAGGSVLYRVVRLET